MGARKNPLQQTGVFGDLANVTNPFERDVQFRARKATPYCQHCGQQVVESSSNKDGSRSDFEWEIQNRAHYDCHREWLNTRRIEEEQAKPIDWDQYMKEHMRE